MISIYSIEKWIHIYTDKLIITKGLWVLVSVAMATLKVELHWKTSHTFQGRDNVHIRGSITSIFCCAQQNMSTFLAVYTFAQT